MEKEGVVVVADVELLTMSGCCTEDGSVTKHFHHHLDGHVSVLYRHRSQMRCLTHEATNQCAGGGTNLGTIS
jgi:hypothetical protein